MTSQPRTSLQKKTTRESSHEDLPKAARERILDTAIQLFYDQGSRAVGIDEVIARSGVAKMSLYRNFRSKDELIGACLVARDRTYWQWWDKIVDRYPGEPRRQLRAVLQAVAERTTESGYRGCFFLNTALNYVEDAHPGRRAAIQHKKTLAERLLKICSQLDVKDPQALARKLLLLINGTQATAGMLGKKTQLELIEAGEALVAYELRNKI